MNLSLPVNDCHTSCFWAVFKHRHACVSQPSLIGDLLRLASENHPPLRDSNLSGPFSKQICGGFSAKRCSLQSLNTILRSSAVCLWSSGKTCLPQERQSSCKLNPHRQKMCQHMQQHNRLTQTLQHLLFHHS